MASTFALNATISHIRSYRCGAAAGKYKKTTIGIISSKHCESSIRRDFVRFPFSKIHIVDDLI